jgi:hypothetical protein
MLTNNEKEILRAIIKDCKKSNISRSDIFEFLKWYLFIDDGIDINRYIKRFGKIASIRFDKVFDTDMIIHIAWHATHFFTIMYEWELGQEKVFKADNQAKIKRVRDAYHYFIDKINHNRNYPIMI